MEQYSTNLYEHWGSGAQDSASAIVPLIVKLTSPKSVVDVGCGLGFWTKAFQDHGVADVFGVDGDWVDVNQLKFSADRFQHADLQQPLRLPRQFDLVVSLEVGEHLPHETSNTFVDSLVSLGPVILFSAAIPYQTGTNHINEQWPEYWAERFLARGYVAIDCIRKHVWNKNIEWWYAQNTIVYCRKDRLDQYPELQKEFENTVPGQLSIIHPNNYLLKADPTHRGHLPFRELVSELPGAVNRAVSWRVKRVVSGKPK